MANYRERKNSLVEEVKKTLEESGEKLDPETLVKLYAIQGGVVEDHGSRFAGVWRLIRLPVMAVFTAGIIFMLTLAFSQSPRALRNSFAGLDDLDILTTSGGPDFYANLDFYDWLAKEGQNDLQQP